MYVVLNAAVSWDTPASAYQAASTLAPSIKV